MHIPIAVCNCHGDQDCTVCGGIGLFPISQDEKLNELLRQSWESLRDQKSCFTCDNMPFCPLPNIALHAVLTGANGNIDMALEILDNANGPLAELLSCDSKLMTYLRIMIGIVAAANKCEDEDEI